MTLKRRLERAERVLEIGRKRAAQLWAQFTEQELENLVRGDKAMIAKAERLGAPAILRQERAHFTPTERAAYERALAEIMQTERTVSNGSTNEL